jgi:hypothetical protein
MQKASAGIVELTGTTVVAVVEEVVVAGVELDAHTPTTLVVVLFVTTADTEVPSVETIRPAPAPNAGVAVGVVIGVAAGFVVVGPVVDTVVELDGAVVATVVDVAVTTVVEVVVATVVDVVVAGVTSIRTLDSLRTTLLLVSTTKMSPFAVTAMPFIKPNKVEAELPSAYPDDAEVPAIENSSGEAPVVSPRIFPGVPMSITECTES